MDIREFVKETLCQIAHGAKESAEDVRGAGGIVNPAARHGRGGESDGHFATLDNGAPVFLVEFDIAVTVTETGELAGATKTGVLSVFSAQVGGKTGTSSEIASRVRFKIPLAIGVDAKTADAIEKHKQEQDRQIREHQNRSNV